MNPEEGFLSSDNVKVSFQSESETTFHLEKHLNHKSDGFKYYETTVS